MGELVVIGFVAGVIAGISPCILPVLPVVLVAGATSPTVVEGGRRWWRMRSRPVAVVAGLVASFSVLILVGSELLSLLHLPQDTLRDAGIALLVLVGLGFVVPSLGELLERPFSRLSTRVPGGGAGGFVLGLGLGVLFVPCAGPILAAITVVGADHRVGLTAVLLTVAFAAGAAVPLLVVALGGSALTQRVRSLRRHAPRLRQLAGVVLVVMALTIGFNTFAGLQRDVPGYTSALQNRFEGGSGVHKKLSALTGNATVHNASLLSCNSAARRLTDCGTAPNFTKITAWLNTPGDRPLTLAALRGKVVLVDFWTYSCINCQRTMPHLRSWYREYARDGFVIVGVHTPEFSFEHVVSNVRAQSAALGVHYPVAIDNAYGTWNAYDNEYWPADYLLDARGIVRHVHFGEGGYADTESLIRALLTEAHPGLRLPPPGVVPDETPTGPLSPETYVGYEREQYLVNPRVVHDRAATYRFPSVLPPEALAYSGTWTEGAQEATAGPGARMELSFDASDVYLVMGGSGTVRVSVDGQHTKTLRLHGVPRLYTLYHSGQLNHGLVGLRVSPGVRAYDFTFG
ncbi:MAG: cytochrome c biogenesis protein DipZ [Acidimicrobiaceae bacterium]|nr:cytochrome c biogenesis protein DipZ [Acidimicrobiaceae bacterium]